MVKMGIIFRSRFILKRLWTRIRWFFLKDYYERLAVQARFLYRQSDLFKLRWRELGLEYAESSFLNPVTGIYFFEKAKHAPLAIRLKLFKDALTNRPMQAYYLEDD